MSAFTRIHSEKLAKFSFSHGAVIHPNAQTIVLAGKVGSIDLKGTMATTFEEQVAATFKNIEIALAEVGATPKDIVHMRYYVTDAQTRDMAAFRRIRKDFLAKFPGAAPAGTILSVRAAEPDILFEVDVIAAIPAQSKL
ncbi:unnamed protein product [Clonostachys rosea]|uniref:RidA family protein n=1 Tax=Bionectria ochroleuca TaxID=29856 RepID=A0ABY6UA08_BIOOC|nr:unnamed protein product [Clonostachys rosea]